MYVLSLIAAVVVFAIAALWAAVGLAGLLGKLPGNRWVGVRTAETLRSRQAWDLAQRVAAPGFLGGAVALAFGGLVALTSRWGFLYALAGFVVGLLALSVLSGVAVRAAQTVAPPPSSSGCTSGCCSGGDTSAEAGHGGGCATGDSTLPPASGETASAAGSSARNGGAAAAAADCGESTCGSCKLSGMCLPEDAAPSPSGSGTGH